MIRRRNAFFFCTLAVFACAVPVTSANAATKGTTVFTCKKTGPGGSFTKSHCRSADKGGGEYSHVAVAANTKTEISGYNESASGEVIWKLKTTLGGGEFEIQATEEPLGGDLENIKDADTGEHRVSMILWMTLRRAVVTKPNDPNCIVTEDVPATKKPGLEEEIDFNSMFATTKGQGDAVNFSPFVGTELASFFVEGCKNKALNGTHTLTGSFKTTSIDGSTLSFTHADTTTQNTLKLDGQKAGMDTTIGLEGRDNSIEGDLMNPLSFTTVETP